MTACECRELHDRHRAAKPNLAHEPCSMRCSACCIASWISVVEAARSRDTTPKTRLPRTKEVPQ